jgi:DNA-binding transcriptional LysR family regulator
MRWWMPRWRAWASASFPASTSATRSPPGRLVPLLEAFRDRPEPVWAVYPQRRYLLPKIQQVIAALETELDEAMNAPAAPAAM